MKIKKLYSIQSKLAYIIGITMFFMLSLFWGGYYYSTKVIAENTIVSELNELNNAALQLEKALQTFAQAKHRPEFYETGEDKYSKEVNTILQTINEKTSKFTLKNNPKNEEIRALFVLVKQQIEQYKKTFNILNANIVKVGNSEYGAFADMKFSSENVRNKVHEYGNNSAKMMYVSIQEQEKVFYTDYTKKSQEELSRLCISLINYIRFLAGSDKYELYGNRQIADATAKYMRDFETYTRVLIKNGLQRKNGTYGQLISYGTELKTSIRSITEKVQNKTQQDSQRNTSYLLIFSICFILIVLLAQLFISKNIIGRLSLLKKKATQAKLSDKEAKQIIKGKDEVSQIAIHIDRIFDSISVHKNFIAALAKEDYTQPLLPPFSDEEIGQALLDLKNRLVFSKNKQTEEAINKEKQDWHVNGLAKFSDILRKYSTDINELSFQLISELTAFLAASIGGFYITDFQDKQVILRLQSSYAFDKKKLLINTIQLGEGIIGTCATEQTTFYYDKIPENYVKIHSGFGSTNPKSLLIVPVATGGKVYGVIELASLNKFSKEAIVFTEKLCEDIASTLSYMSSNIENEKRLTKMSLEIEALKKQLDEHSIIAQ